MKLKIILISWRERNKGEGKVFSSYSVSSKTNNNVISNCEESKKEEREIDVEIIPNDMVVHGGEFSFFSVFYFDSVFVLYDVCQVE